MLLLLFIIWLAVGSWLGGKILYKLLPLEKKLVWPLGIFLPIFLLGLVANIFTAWFKLNDLAIIVSFLIVILLLVSAWLLLRHRERPAGEEIDKEGRYHWPKLLSVFFVIILVIGFWLLSLSVSGDSLLTPWQTINLCYLPVIFCLLLSLLGAVFSRAKLGGVLLMIILSSLLIHSYLLVYKEGFGGDRWRHLASETRIMADMEYQPTLLSDDLWYKEIFGLSVPRALIDPGKISYGMSWSLEIIAAKLSGLEVFDINKLLLPLLWSVFLPLIIAALAALIWSNRLFVLFSAALAGFFYLLQYYGAQGLPIGYGILWWSFFLLFVAAALKAPLRRFVPVLAALAALMYFNYSVAFVLSIMSLILWLAFRLKPALRCLLVVLLSISLFLLEVFLAGGRFTFNGFWSWWRDGNLLFFEAGRALPYISSYRFLALSIIFIIILVVIILNIFRGKNRLMNFVAWLFIVITVNYVLAWIFIDGDLNLARRLTAFAALLLPLLFGWGIIENLRKMKKTSLAFVLIFICILGVLAYRSGPVLSVSVSSADWRAAQLVWQEIKNDYSDYCVLGDIKLLLPLETLSGKEVVNGNFPLQENYVDKSRPQLYREFISGGNYSIIDDTLAQSQKEHCVFTASEEKINNMPRQFIDWLGQNLEGVAADDYFIGKK